LDDVFVFNDTLDHHVNHLKQVFNTLKQNQLALNLKKSEFAKANIVYLGYVVGRGVLNNYPKNI